MEEINLKGYKLSVYKGATFPYSLRDPKNGVGVKSFKTEEGLKAWLNTVPEKKKEYCACGFPQSSPTPHAHSI